MNKVKQSLLAVLIGLFVGSTVLLTQGVNPVSGFTSLFIGGFGDLRVIGNTLGVATIYTLAGLSVAVAFKTGLFNIGVPGQMLFGSFMAFWFSVSIGIHLPGILSLLLAIIIAIISAGGIGYLIGYLKVKFSVHEVVSSIMLNWIIFNFVRWGVFKFGFGVIGTGGDLSNSISLPDSHTFKSEFLENIFALNTISSRFISMAILLAIFATVLITIMMNKSSIGYKLKLTGASQSASKYTGINVNNMASMSMAISGALAGLAGVALNFGYQSRIDTPLTDILPTWGFDAIVIALVAFSFTKWIWIPAIFFAIIRVGTTKLSLDNVGLSTEIVPIISGIILYSTGFTAAILQVIKSKKKPSDKGGVK